MENINQFTDFIWEIKELNRDEYAEKDYEEVILPFTPIEAFGLCT